MKPIDITPTEEMLSDLASYIIGIYDPDYGEPDYSDDLYEPGVFRLVREFCQKRQLDFEVVRRELAARHIESDYDAMDLIDLTVSRYLEACQQAQRERDGRIMSRLKDALLLAQKHHAHSDYVDSKGKRFGHASLEDFVLECLRPNKRGRKKRK